MQDIVAIYLQSLTLSLSIIAVHYLFAFELVGHGHDDFESSLVESLMEDSPFWNVYLMIFSDLYTLQG